MKQLKLNLSRPHQKYYVGKTMVEGVTTILGVINKPQLMHWAWKMGMDGKDYKKESGRAATIGTIAHFMCECFIRGYSPDLSDCVASDVRVAAGCCKKFIQFWKREGFRLSRSEAQLVSSKFMYGGTLDITTKCGALIDIKTSKGIYEEYWYQVAAYKLLATENKIKISRHIIIRIGKDDAGFEVQERPTLDREWLVFDAARRLKAAMK